MGRNDEPLLPARPLRPAGQPAGARHHELRHRGFHAAYGKTEAEAEPIFRRYLEAGGNLIDTADFYTAGRERDHPRQADRRAGVRDRLVLTSKFTNTVDPADPNAGGNGRKHMIRAVEASLRRLGTDYLDLYLLHTWDRITPVEEVVRTFDDLVRAGKIRYAGLSDVPAWYAARAQTFAEAHALTPMINVQLPYSLVRATSRRSTCRWPRPSAWA